MLSRTEHKLFYNLNTTVIALTSIINTLKSKLNNRYCVCVCVITLGHRRGCIRYFIRSTVNGGAFYLNYIIYFHRWAKTYLLNLSPMFNIQNIPFGCRIPVQQFSSHFSDVIMRVMASQITSGCLHNCLFRRRLKKTSKLCVTDLCEGNPQVTDEPMDSPHKWPVIQKMFPFDDVIIHISDTSDIGPVMWKVFTWHDVIMILTYFCTYREVLQYTWPLIFTH